jgi:hypothetical protein
MRRMPMCAAVAAVFTLTIMACGSNDNSADDSGTDAPAGDGSQKDSGRDAKADAGQDAATDATGRDGAADAPSETSEAGDDVTEAGDDANDAEAGDDATDGSGDDADATLDGPPDSTLDSPLDADDGGLPDAMVVCGSKIGFGFGGVGDGGMLMCGTGEDYTCANDGYEILCECPTQVCTCSRNKVLLKTIPYAGCPSCQLPNFAQIAAACGIPY